MKTHNLLLWSKDYSEKEIEENCHLFNKHDWEVCSGNQILSEKFIEKHQDKLDWNEISWYQILSERFIEKHKDKVHWKTISLFQKLSKKFIKKNLAKLNVDLLLTNYKISNEVRAEIKLLKEII